VIALVNPSDHVLPTARVLGDRSVAGARSGRPTMLSLALTALTAVTIVATPASAQDVTDTLKKIRGSGRLTLGVREASSPLSFATGGQFTGYHVELCRRLVEDLKTHLNIPAIRIDYQRVNSDNRVPFVKKGLVDLECGSTTNTRDRQREVAFALTTYVTEVRMAVKADSTITSVDQLKGKTVVTTSGTTAVQHLRRRERALGTFVDFKEVYAKDHATAFLMLESGRADAFVMDDNILAAHIASAKNPGDFRIVGEVLSTEPIAVMFRRDDPALKRAVDDTIRRMMASGELEKLYAQWFQSPIPPRGRNLNMPMSATLRSLIGSPNDRPMEEYVRK
jgi:glutamate/aspartate transport system substrate-binding protein